jgi:hypothetical protein
MDFGVRIGWFAAVVVGFVVVGVLLVAGAAVVWLVFGQSRRSRSRNQNNNPMSASS